MEREPSAGVGFFLLKAQHLLEVSCGTALQQFELTPAQFNVLIHLADGTSRSGAALARYCFVTPQAMSGVVKNLETLGFISRATDPDHRRIIRFSITGSGSAIFSQARGAVARVEERMLADLDRAERDALADLLAQCADALQSSRDTGPPR